MGTLMTMAYFKFFPMAIASFGFHYVLYFFAAMTAVMVTWGFMTIKDTDQLSLTKIQDMGGDAERKKEREDETKAVNEGNFKAIELFMFIKLEGARPYNISTFRLLTSTQKMVTSQYQF